MSVWIWAVVVGGGLVALVVAGLAGRFLRRSFRSRRLQRRFGSEYDRMVKLQGREQGEDQLDTRLTQRKALVLHELSPEQALTARDSLQQAQATFVDSPLIAVRDADHIVFDVMRSRGYPLEGIDTRAAAISVDHPPLAERYRSAYEALVTAEQAADPDVGTLHTAMMTYRELLTVLLEVPATAPAGSPVLPQVIASDRDEATAA